MIGILLKYVKVQRFLPTYMYYACHNYFATSSIIPMSGIILLERYNQMLFYLKKFIKN